MEFDKSRVYTALNADELKVGSNVILADGLTELKKYVEQNYDADMLLEVRSGDYSERFRNNSGSWHLAYLIEEPEEKKLRWTDLKVGDIITNGNLTAMVTEIDNEHHMHICVGHKWYENEELEEWKKVEK